MVRSEVPYLKMSDVVEEESVEELSEELSSSREVLARGVLRKCEVDCAEMLIRRSNKNRSEMGTDFIAVEVFFIFLIDLLISFLDWDVWQRDSQFLFSESSELIYFKFLFFSAFLHDSCWMCLHINKIYRAFK